MQMFYSNGNINLIITICVFILQGNMNHGLRRKGGVKDRSVSYVMPLSSANIDSYQYYKYELRLLINSMMFSFVTSFALVKKRNSNLRAFISSHYTDNVINIVANSNFNHLPANFVCFVPMQERLNRSQSQRDFM